MTVPATHYHWLATGDEMFAAMLESIAQARRSVRLETYIVAPEWPGVEFLAELIEARRRGVTVRVLVDAFGSMELPDSFWDGLRKVGGEVRQFNPLSFNRLGIRNHRKCLVCDETLAFVGGFNIAPEYAGDGLATGWCDLGLQVTSRLVPELAAAFDDLFERAEQRPQRLAALRRSQAKRAIRTAQEQLLLSGPGRGRSPIKRALRHDLRGARQVQIIAAYFLPTRSLRRALGKVARRGGQVELLLPGKSDVAVAQLAAQSLYRRLLKAGVRIYEYQPQVLHAKLIIVDGVVYGGSANLDQRSLNINYELMIRLKEPEAVREAQTIFARHRAHALEITAEAWQASRSLWRRIKQHWAYFLLVRLDPLWMRWQIRRSGVDLAERVQRDKATR